MELISPAPKEAPVPYYVTFVEPGAEALRSERPRAVELMVAITRAYQLIDDGKLDVAISDNKGHSIAGEDLLACWRGEKAITADLKAL
jgi:hypothetical protein